VGDLRSARLALQGLAVIGGGEFEPVKEKFAALDQSLRFLESGHAIAELLDGLNHLAIAERWEIRSARSGTSTPRTWEWLELRLRTVPEELGRIQPPEPTRKIVQDAQQLVREAHRQSPAQAIGREMKERLKPERSPAAIAHEVEKLIPADPAGAGAFPQADGGSTRDAGGAHAEAAGADGAAGEGSRGVA
jgi:hypothetical protein